MGTEVRVTGQGLPAGKTIDLIWETVRGGWVVEEYYFFRGKKFIEATESLGRFPVGRDGRLAARFRIPEDYGGVHVETSVVSISPASGPAGTPVSIHLKGVGWTEYDNIYTVVYDNAYMGYACGFNSQGGIVSSPHCLFAAAA